ncbi:MAG: alpha-galactosidase [Treponema sp.]|jgi:alpha-galactosidase|nr:alpha-galactosidase [Treponema sp.]
MKALRYVLSGKPGREGVLPLAAWELPELLEAAGAGEEARSAFEAGPVMLQTGGWQSWTAGWELAPGETLPARVRLIPALRKMSAPPWDCGRNGNAPAASGKGEAAGSFIMYLRAGDWYLALAEEPDEALRGPLCFFISPDRRHIRAGLYCPGLEGGGAAGIRIFLVRGYFALKDALGDLYRQGDRFAALAWLGKRPGGYESWYNHYTHINEDLLLRDLDGLGRTGNLIKLRYLDRGEPAVFQIDDGWEKAVGEWEADPLRFPRGLKPLAERIEEAGLIPGLWLAPFLVTRKCGIFRNRPHWLLREQDGSPVKAGWNPHWDGTFYCLDLSRGDVLEYLGALMEEVTGRWGFRYIKLDFLYTAFFYGRFASGGTPADHYHRALAVLESRSKTPSGLPAAFLGCGLPLGPSFRHFPLSRIGTDTRETWDWPLARFLRHTGRPSALLSLKDTIGRSFLNRTLFINDPDVIFLRSRRCALTGTEKECIALVNYVLAGQIMFSDNPLFLDGEDLALTGRISALYDRLEGDEYGALPLEGRGGKPSGAYRLISRSGKTGGIINLGDRPWTPPEPLPAGGAWLLDRRIPGSGSFAPRSVSIMVWD